MSVAMQYIGMTFKILCIVLATAWLTNENQLMVIHIFEKRYRSFLINFRLLIKNNQMMYTVFYSNAKIVTMMLHMRKVAYTPRMRGERVENALYIKRAHQKWKYSTV